MTIAAHPVVVRIADWIAGRHGPEAGDVTLDRRRVYILPTAPGLAFGVVTLILLIGSINYMLQLGYLLTFLVASMAVVGMHHTHSNLAQIVLRGVQVEPVYAGDVAAFESRYRIQRRSIVSRCASRLRHHGAQLPFSAASSRQRATVNSQRSPSSCQRAFADRRSAVAGTRFAAACPRLA
jgi:hypothetical protein